MLKRAQNTLIIILTAFTALFFAAGLYFIGDCGAYAAEGDVVHAVCGGTDCGHDGHGEITYLPWTDEASLPSYGNYYLTRDYTDVVMYVRKKAASLTTEEGGETETTTPAETSDTSGEVDDAELNLDLNGFKIKSTTTSPAIEVYSRLNLCDSSAERTGCIVNTSTVTGCAALRVSDFGELNLYGGAVEGQYAAVHNNGRGTVNLYGGTVTGNVNGLVCGGGVINIAQAEGLSLTLSGQVGVTATVGTINISNGTVNGTARGLETKNSAAATVTGGTVTGEEYDVYCASSGAVRLEGSPVFSQAPAFFVANNADLPANCSLNVLRYTFTDGADDVRIALYTDIANVVAGKFLVNCTEEQSSKLVCGNEELILEYEANGLKMSPVIAIIGEDRYKTLAEAFVEASKPENAWCTVKLVSDISISDATELSSAFTLDLNGRSITSATEPVINAVSGADIVITDSAGGGSLVNRAGDALNVAGGRVTLSSTLTVSGVRICTTAATAANAALRLLNLTGWEEKKLKITLGAECDAEEYFAACDADYGEYLEVAAESGEAAPYVLVYSESDGAIKLHVHVYDILFTVDVPATCTEAGSKSRHCAGCGEVTDVTPIEATGHSWREATCTEARTCTACGLTQGDALGHSWQEATCTEAGHCPVCGTYEGEALGHQFGNWTVTTRPDDGNDGEAEHTCSRCRLKFTEVLPALTSGEYAVTEVAATINADAYTSYSIEIGGKTVTFKVVKEGTKLIHSQTETGDSGGSASEKTATVIAVVCVAVFAVVVVAVVLYIYGVFDKKRRRK